MSTKLRRKKETLEGMQRYHRLLLTPAFKQHLEKRKSALEDKVYHLRHIAQDCDDWKTSDLEAIKRGMAVSTLKYRLAKELAQQARDVLDDMLSDVYPFLSDPRGLEEKVWEVFDDEEVSDADETERKEAEKKLDIAGFSLPALNIKDEEDPSPHLKPMTEDHIDDVLRQETTRVNTETETLLAILEEKRNQLENLRDLSDYDNRSSSNGDSQ